MLVFTSAVLFYLHGSPQPVGAQGSPAEPGKDQKKDENKEKGEKKPSKELEKPCAKGKLLVRHAYSECGPDGFWHVVEDDYYDCPPVTKFRVWDQATEQPCKGDKAVPAPNPVGTAYSTQPPPNCRAPISRGFIQIYRCEDGFWVLVTYEIMECLDDQKQYLDEKGKKKTGKRCDEPPPEIEIPKTAESVTPGESPAEGHGMAPRNTDRGRSYASLVAAHQISVDITGTGQTIGHVADVRIDNLSDQPVNFAIPPVVLESGSGKNQDYVIPQTEDVALKPHESKTVPMNGVCANRHKPPVGNGIGGDLVTNDPTGRIPHDAHSHLNNKDADKLLRLCTAKYDAADKLEGDGQLKDMPYKDKKKRKEIVEQWSVWMDPRISDIEGGPPATKDDLKKIVYKQLPHTPTGDEKKKIDKGIDTIFDKIELTTEKAKDLETPEEQGGEETPPPMPPASVNVSNDTPTPGPKTQEKPKEKPKEKPGETPAKSEKPPMTTTRLLVNVPKGVDAHDADDVTRPSKDSIKKDLSKAIKDANKLLSKCGVQLELAGADIVFDATNPDTPGSENMGGNYDGDKAKDIDKKASEELKKAHGQPTKGFKVYIVTEITNKSGSEQGVGYWFPEEGSDATHPGFCIIEASAVKDGRLLAHELGHGLGGLSDEDKKGNLMNPKPGVSDANDLSDDQCKKLQNGAKQRE